MAFTKRCFANVPSLKQRHPQVLRDLLCLFPQHAAERKLTLPEHATVENLDYDGIRDALMDGDIPENLDDILFLSSLLGNSKGWGMIERQAREDGKILPKVVAQFGYVDLAILAATHDWPNNKDILERANARARVHSKSAYVYYAPAMDKRAAYREPTAESLTEARELLSDHFVQTGLVPADERRKATEIVPYDFEKEIWFLIRYPGRKSRHNGYNEGDWKHFVFNPEQYDAIAYNKVYGDLRMNTRRKMDHSKYRIAFTHLLFDQPNAFRETGSVVVLDPLLRDDAAELFTCGDIPGLGWIAPVELTYEVWGMPPREICETAKDGNTLLLGNRHAPRILPKEVNWVRRAVFQYRMKNSPRLARLSIDGANKISFERDGDSVVVEEWLRRRGFVKSYLKVEAHEPINLEQDIPIAASA